MACVNCSRLVEERVHHQLSYVDGCKKAISNAEQRLRVAESQYQDLLREFQQVQADLRTRITKFEKKHNFAEREIRDLQKSRHDAEENYCRAIQVISQRDHDLLQNEIEASMKLRQLLEVEAEVNTKLLKRISFSGDSILLSMPRDSERQEVQPTCLLAETTKESPITKNDV